jgi:hypothetical protein
METPKYKQKLCECCNETYGINYYYVHKRSRRHLLNSNRQKKKEELLNDCNIKENLVEKESINDMIKCIEDNLEKIKNYLII